MEIYAEISRKLQMQIDAGETILLFPYGVKYRRKAGSRVLNIECDDDILGEVTDILDDRGISFQHDDIKKKESKEESRGEKSKTRNSRY